jgi:hypothetical protein
MRSRANLLATGILPALSTAMFVTAAFADPCPLAFLSTYLATDFSCTLEDKTLSGFTYTQNPGAPSPTVVTASPDTTVSHNPGLVLNFTGVLTVPMGDTVIVPIGFNLVAPPDDPVTDLSLSVAATVTDGGSVVDQEMFGAAPSLMVCVGVAGCPSTASASLATRVTSATVVDTLTVVGSAADPIVRKNFSETPTVTPTLELASLGLLGAGLGALWLVRRRWGFRPMVF